MKPLSWRVLHRHPRRFIYAYKSFLFSPVSLKRINDSWLYIVTIIFYLALTNSTAAQDNRGILISSERLALVIGNNAYQKAPLRNPVNDAEDMGNVLSTLGFKVILQKNLDRRAMEDSIRSFGRQLRNGGVGLFYFAGHGMQVEGRNYLIPVNARIESESDIKYEAVDAGLLLGKMEDAENQLNIVILDACRNNPFSRHFRSREQGLARMDAPAGSLIAYSTAPGTVAADGDERNGTFTKHLIRHIRTPNLPVEQVLKRVRIDVAAETKQRQIPWESSSLMGDFYFKTERVVHTSPTVVAETEKSTPKNQQPISAPEKTTSGIQENKTEYAALPPRISEPPTNTIKKKLAIFPFRFSSDRPSQAESKHFTQIKKFAIASVKEVLIDNLNFAPSYSYYVLGDKIKYQQIPLTVLNTNMEADLLNKENGKPNIDFVVRLGRQLGVDTVFICNSTVEAIDLYLIEVNQKGIFHKNNIYEDSAGYSNVSKHIRDFFESYKIEKAPESAGIHPSGAPPTPPKETIISIPKSETITSPTSLTKQSLAIFPIYFSFSGNYLNNYGEIKKATFESLKKLLINNKDFSPIYSYYELPKELEYRKISPNILNDKIANDLWVKEGFFALKKKPNIPLIAQLGRKLDVDNVLMIDCAADSIGIFFIEVNGGKVFLKEGFFNASNGYTEVPKQMNGFLTNYKNYMLKK